MPRIRTLAAAAAALCMLLAPASASADEPYLWYEGFNQANGANGLITNEYAYWHPSDALAVRSPAWEMDSGSLFSIGGTGRSGPVQACSVDRYSEACTNSAVLRLVTRRRDYRDVLVQTSLRTVRLSQTSATPAVAWDGVHLFLRYQSEHHLYYATVNRRDGELVIKKKCPGGSSNGGTYYTLASTGGHSIQYSRWQLVGASVQDRADGGVELAVHVDGVRRLTAVDGGTGCAAISQAGGVGVRGDNAEIELDGFAVQPIASPLPTVAITAPADGATVASPVTLAAAADDDRAITKVAFLADGVRVGQDYAPPYRVTWQPAEGAHSLVARAYDLEGNSSDSAVVGVRR